MEPPPEFMAARQRFLELVKDLRPVLHRYCSRLVGSAIDGEDVVQETLAKAYYALSLGSELPPLKPWLLRIGHNTAIDFLRRYDRRFVEPTGAVETLGAEEPSVAPEVVRVALSSFVALPLLQRSAVILKDVLGLSAEEVAQTTGTSIPAVKAALVRGRAALRAQPKQASAWRDRPETTLEDRRRLEAYAALFNARDWPGLESLLAEECRLDLVSKAARFGRKQVSGYFAHYANESVRLAAGLAEGRAVLGAFNGGNASRNPDYVIAMDFEGDRIALIRDWRYVPYLAGELVFELGV